MKTNLTPEAVMIELNRIKTDTRPTIDFDRRNAALDYAKRAVRKQIPRKPLPGDINGRVCPCCGSQLLDNFCGNCGQALDWR